MCLQSRNAFLCEMIGFVHTCTFAREAGSVVACVPLLVGVCTPVLVGEWVPLQVGEGGHREGDLWL